MSFKEFLLEREDPLTDIHDNPSMDKIRSVTKNTISKLAPDSSGGRFSVDDSGNVYFGSSLNHTHYNLNKHAGIRRAAVAGYTFHDPKTGEYGWDAYDGRAGQFGGRIGDEHKDNPFLKRLTAAGFKPKTGKFKAYEE